VAATIGREGIRLLGAQGTGVGLLEAEDTRFRFCDLRGTDHEAATAWQTFPNDRAIPYGEAVATRRVLCLPSQAAVAERFPRVGADLARRGLEALVVLPLVGSDETALGAAHLAFAVPHAFGATETREFEDLAQECGQALERARLFEAERAARAEAEAARTVAEAANRAKMDFLATMSHELRTPLNAIGGYAELLALGVRGPVTTAQQEDLARIQRSQQHLLGLINEVLNFARLEGGAVHFDLADLEVASLLGGLEALVLPQVRAKGLSLTLAACDPALRVRADAEKLRQILLNLLSNAVKFTASGGSIHVDAGCADADAPAGVARGAVAITVRDTGVGIAAHQLAAIFEPFVQVGRALNNPGEGTGLGLAISRDLARAMGGELTAESTPGAGSVFRLVLPRRV
jgi:signal transduction histidine kinase